MDHEEKYSEEKNLKGRGAQINTPNKYDQLSRGKDANYFAEEDFNIKTKYIPTKVKSIINKVDSPDVPFGYSTNPYQGCEHGCVYCYARNSHTYWGYSAGIDFETQIIVKENAPDVLRKKLQSKSWKAQPIMLSGNTDCYQPAEKKYELTRQILDIFHQYRHPVGIITKNSMVLRDMDILQKLAADDLIMVNISINSLQEEIRQFLEPRTATYAKRLDTIKQLSEANIPVRVLAAPMIPGLNNHEIMDLVRECKEAGAQDISMMVVRLNGDIAEIFAHWVEKMYPDRSQKILNQIKSLHQGKLNDSRWGQRMKGSGNIADIMHQQFRLAKKKYFTTPYSFQYNTSLHDIYKDGQLRLF